MKPKHKVQRFDYRKIEQADDCYQYYEFFGIHPKHGRLRIDTKRFKKILVSLSAEKFWHAGMSETRQTVYLMPSKIRRHDYCVNIARDILFALKGDWEEEYKPLLGSVKSPKDIYEQSRISSLMSTGCSDDYGEIETDALLEAAQRMKDYERIIRSLYFQFVCKLCSEVERIMLLLITNLGYSRTAFEKKDFDSFTDQLKGASNPIKLSNIKNYPSLDKLRKINNFLKHNTVSAYKKLKKRDATMVVNEIAGKPYTNGMFAGDWIVINGNYIDETIENLVIFFEDYCHTFCGEDLEKSKWDYDEYFKLVYKQLRHHETRFNI